MTFYIPPIIQSTDTFGQWIYKSNQVHAVLSNNAITTDSGRPTPSNTAVGNASITGTFNSGGLVATSNVKIGLSTSNIYMQQQYITIQAGSSTNNTISSNGSLLDSSTFYYKELMLLGNTVIRGANVSSNDAFFNTVRIGNTSQRAVLMNNTGIITIKANTNILYVTGPGAFGSFGTSEANVYLTKDSVEVYANPTGFAQSNSKLTSTDLWVTNIHANNYFAKNAFFDTLGVNSAQYITVISNTHFTANTKFFGSNNQFVTGLASNGNVSIVGPDIHFSHQYYGDGTAANGGSPVSANAVFLWNGPGGGAVFTRNLTNNPAIAATSLLTSTIAEWWRLGEGKATFNIGTGVAGAAPTNTYTPVSFGNNVSYISSNVSIGIGISEPYKSSPALSLVVQNGMMFVGNTSGQVILKANTVAGDATFILPSSMGTAGQGLITDGGGKLGFATLYAGPAASDYVRIAGLGVGVAFNPAPAGFGEIRAGGNITAYYSDKRLKKNIQPINDSLAKISMLNGVSFNSNELAKSHGYHDDSRQVGVIAQDVQSVLPEAVKLAPFDTDYKDGEMISKSGENFLTVQYEKIVPLLIEAIKELKKEIEELKASK